MSIFGDVDELTGGFADALGERLERRPSRQGPTPLEAYLAKFQATAPSWQALGSAQAAGAWSPGVPSWQSFGQRQDVGLWQPQAQGWQQAGDFFGQYRQAKGAREQAEQAAAGKSGTAVEAGDWSGPATADDNATLDGAKIDSWIAATRPNSPLRGKGAYILAEANKYGVSAPLLLGIFLKESELGTTAGPGYNIAGVGGEGNFAQYGSWEQAIDGAAANLGGPTYKGKSAADQIGYWFTGRAGDMAATDSTGGRNGTVQSYLDGPVAAAYSGLGVPFNQRAPGTRRAVADAESAMPVQGFAGEIRTHWDSDERGATDIFAAQGTPVLALTNGQVTYAGYDPTGGYNVMIRSDDGTDEYYAHLWQAPMVGAGQRVRAGQQLGGVGNTGNAATVPGFHLHLGKGFGVQQGTGPHGGAGNNFDLVSYLQARQQRGRTAARPPARPATTGGTVRY